MTRNEEAFYEYFREMYSLMDKSEEFLRKIINKTHEKSYQKDTKNT